MTTAEWISVIALIISSGGFAIQARSWILSGPRLHLSIIADAMLIPDEEGPRAALTVINRGTAPTMLTHMVVYLYRSRWRRFRNKSYLAGVVNSDRIPSKVDINGTWNGLMAYNDKTIEGRKQGHLYIGVIASHANGSYLVRVPPAKEVRVPTETIASGG